MKAIRIENATPDDQNQLEKTFQHFKDKTAMRKRAECYLFHNNTILAKDGKLIVGKVLWYVKENPNDGLVELEELFILEDYRRKGVGSELIKFCINAVQNHFKNLGIKPRRIYLFTNENNEGARKLYENFGFEPIANLGHLYSDDENDLFYVLDLTKKNDLSKNE
ncbi:MAG: GNAT family N-acetyltransferase [Promethearchaeota archaeon]|jgi:ribosomal protein S18 acetylase RimI-like enzyme